MHTAFGKFLGTKYGNLIAIQKKYPFLTLLLAENAVEEMFSPHWAPFVFSANPRLRHALVRDMKALGKDGG